MSNVIDLQARRKEKELKDEKRKKELDKRRNFQLNMDEANILINSYINYLNGQLEEFKELITDEDKQIARNEIKTMFSLLRMLFKKYKSSDYYDDIIMSWTYKNLYYTTMAAYASLDEDIEYEFMEREEKIETNLYYRLVDLDHEIGKLMYGSSIHKLPMSEAELMAENEYDLFKYKFNAEFLNKITIIEDPAQGVGEGYFVRQFPVEFKKVLKRLEQSNMATYNKDSYPKGWRISMGWDELIELISWCTVEVVPYSVQEMEEVAHIYSIELLEEQIANIINRMENIGMKVNGSFLGD